jgi:hypothetical protein
VLAYRIVDWRAKYEVTDHNKPAKADTPLEKLRKSPLPYIRYSNNGLLLSPEDRKLNKKAWAIGCLFELAVHGLYVDLLDITRDQTREYRGWILDRKHRPLNAYQVADVLEVQDSQYILALFELLCEVELLEHLELVYNDGSPPDSPDQGEEGSALGGETGGLYQNETEANTSLNQTETFPRSGGSTPAPSPASETDSGSGFSASDLETRPTSGRGYLISDIPQKKAVFLSELSSILHPQNGGDITTFQDLSKQLEARMIQETELDLFELAIEKARLCHRGRRPIGMFIAAMKEEPFNYVPRGTSVIRGKMDRYKNNV